MITTPTNLDQYIDDLRLYIGDMNEALYSDNYLRTALVNAVRYLSRRWNNRYLIYGSGIKSTSTPYPAGYFIVNSPDGAITVPDTIQENDVFRNTYFAFSSTEPPIIDQGDVPALLLAAAYLVVNSQLNSSSASLGYSWYTPDLSFSNIEGAKTLKQLIKQYLDALDMFFKIRLGRMKIGRLQRLVEPTFFDPVETANWYVRIASGNEIER